MDFCAFGLLKRTLAKRHPRTLNGLWKTVEERNEISQKKCENGLKDEEIQRAVRITDFQDLKSALKFEVATQASCIDRHSIRGARVTADAPCESPWRKDIKKLKEEIQDLYSSSTSEPEETYHHVLGSMATQGISEVTTPEQIEHLECGKTFIHQEALCRKILSRFDMINSNHVSTHIEKSVITTEDSVSLSAERDVPYGEAVGSLVFLAFVTRPDIAYAVEVLSQVLDKPQQIHWTMVKRILRKFWRGAVEFITVFLPESILDFPTPIPNKITVLWATRYWAITLMSAYGSNVKHLAFTPLDSWVISGQQL
ncbi:retrovirus-related Pol polyprotein from transposon TNT 1-94 [Trichonephila clavipes]|nr:retrovirus-related Pol polyprotein from transposon TNT 1-94 [Trichonephila clavipes]